MAPWKKLSFMPFTPYGFSSIEASIPICPWAPTTSETGRLLSVNLSLVICWILWAAWDRVPEMIRPPPPTSFDSYLCLKICEGWRPWMLKRFLSSLKSERLLLPNNVSLWALFIASRVVVWNSLIRLVSLNLFSYGEWNIMSPIRSCVSSLEDFFSNGFLRDCGSFLERPVLTLGDTFTVAWYLLGLS